MPEKVVRLSNIGTGFALDPVAKKINVTPSADADNALVLGTDNLLYVDSGACCGVSAVTLVTGAYTVLPTDQVVIHTGAAATYTMPAAGASTGRVLTITNQGTGTVTLSAPYRTAGGVTGGTTTTTIAASTSSALRSVRLISDGVQWRRIG